ncbi:eukaryotic translation initiation factor 3 subunit A-like [Grus americana]|uniref:eukaryotic translation initiation factor 3 subunit A-like n=1 Tax=Grus americana TaxID=9117 RepID=UPI0024077CF2|nr:eukaryotic translation initiation factor 3 subunit A-like [Grus americana]
MAAERCLHRRGAARPGGEGCAEPGHGAGSGSGRLGLEKEKPPLEGVVGWRRRPVSSLRLSPPARSGAGTFLPATGERLLARPRGPPRQRTSAWRGSRRAADGEGGGGRPREHRPSPRASDRWSGARQREPRGRHVAGGGAGAARRRSAGRAPRERDLARPRRPAGVRAGRGGRRGWAWPPASFDPAGRCVKRLGCGPGVRSGGLEEGWFLGRREGPQSGFRESRTSQALARLSAHGDGLLLCLSDFLLEGFPAFLDSSALQDCLPRDSANQAPKQANICPPEVQGSSSADPPPYFSENQKLCYFMIAVPKTASNHHITHKSFSVHKQQQTSGKLQSPMRTRSSDCETSLSCL